MQRANPGRKSVLEPREESPGIFDPLQMYLLEVKQFELLTREEEVELAKRVREKKDAKAADRLITSNLRLVVKMAMNFNRYWTKNLLDLIQEGNVGLLHAVRGFDPYRGIKFSYYASFWIKAHLFRFVMDNWKLVKIGTTQSKRKLFFNLTKEKERMVSQGLTPEPRLLAERLNVKEEEVQEMEQRLGAWEISLNSSVDGDSRESFSTLIPDPGLGADELLSLDQSRRKLAKKLKKFRRMLSGRDADIFDHRILTENPLTLKELGTKHHISRERVRQLQEKTLRRIEDWLRKEVPDFDEEYAHFLE